MPVKKTTAKNKEVKTVAKEKEVKEVAKDRLSDIKAELKSYIDAKMEDSIIKKIETSNRLLIREKNKKILVKNIWINILLLVIVGLLFVLNSEGFFAKHFTREGLENSNNSIVENKDKPDSEPAPKTGPTLEELIETYGPLLNKVTSAEDSTYIKEYYRGSLSKEIRNYLALNNLSDEQIHSEDDYNIIDEANLKKSYENIFNTTYESASFTYNGTKVIYVSKLDSYLTDELIKKEKSNIKRTITNIKLEDGTVLITTMEGYTKDDKLYNILTNEETKREDLMKVVYTFKDNKLVNIKGEVNE